MDYNSRLKIRAYDLKAKSQKWAFLANAYGIECSQCGATERLDYHRWDGMPHKELILMSYGELNDIIKNHKDDYTRICKSCHKKAHDFISRELALPTSI